MSLSTRDKKAEKIADIIACRHTTEALTPLGMAYDILALIEKDPERVQWKDKAKILDFLYEDFGPMLGSVEMKEKLEKADKWNPLMDKMMAKDRCKKCHGTGTYADDKPWTKKCPHCNGTGYTKRKAMSEDVSEFLEAVLVRGEHSRIIFKENHWVFVSKSATILYMKQEEK